MLKKVLAVAVALGVTTGAQAFDLAGLEVTPYVQGNLGQAKAKKPKVVKEEIDLVKEWGGRTSTDRTDLAYKLIVGLQFNDYFAVEAQYLDLGKSTYKGKLSFNDGEGADVHVKEKLDMETSGLGFNVVGSYPVTEDFSVFAKTGLHYLKTKGTQKFSIAGFDEDDGSYLGGDGEKASKSVRKWTNSIGVGASYQIIPNLSVVGEYERYRNVANKTVRDEDGDKLKFKHNIDLLSVGLRYNF